VTAAGERRARPAKQSARGDRAKPDSPKRTSTAAAVSAAEPAADTAEAAQVTGATKAAAVSEDAKTAEVTSATEAAAVSEDTEVAEVAEVTSAAEAAAVSEDAQAGADSGTTEESEAAQSPEQRERAEQERQERRRERRELRERRERRLMLLPVALGLATVVLGGLAVWFGIEAHDVTSSPTARNTAVTDTATTSALRSQITSAVNSLLSYNYADPSRTTRAASRLLAGAGVQQYDSLFGQVSQAPASDKVLVTTTVTSVGVESLTGDHAIVLVFAQIKQGSAGAPAQTGTGTLAINAVRQGSTWKIDGLTTI
jgi:Mce-associated membrane protein